MIESSYPTGQEPGFATPTVWSPRAIVEVGEPVVVNVPVFGSYSSADQSRHPQRQEPSALSSL